jgi:hypothetical protein
MRGAPARTGAPRSAAPPAAPRAPAPPRHNLTAPAPRRTPPLPLSLPQLPRHHRPLLLRLLRVLPTPGPGPQAAAGKGVLEGAQEACPPGAFPARPPAHRAKGVTSARCRVCDAAQRSTSQHGQHSTASTAQRRNRMVQGVRRGPEVLPAQHVRGEPGAPPVTLPLSCNAPFTARPAIGPRAPMALPSRRSKSKPNL